jgi:hypothetical protein
VHIEWNSIFGLKCHFAHSSRKKKQGSSPYMYASNMCNNFERKQVLRDAQEKRITTNKTGETYGKSVKIE